MPCAIQAALPFLISRSNTVRELGKRFLVAHQISKKPLDLPRSNSGLFQQNRLLAGNYLVAVKLTYYCETVRM